MSLATPPTSVARQVADTRRLLSSSLADELSTLASDYKIDDQTLTLSTSPRRLGPGTVLSSGEATWYVLSSDGPVCTVISGYEGNPDVDVDAGAVVRVAPRFTDFQLFTVVQQVIGSLSSPMNGLVGFVHWETNGTSEMFDIPDDLADYAPKIVQVRSMIGDSDDWVINPSWSATYNQPDNLTVRVFTPATMHRFVASVKIVPPAAFDDDVIENCGLTDTMLDIPSLGAASILMNGQEARRMHMEAQGDPRRAESTPITGATNAARELRRMFRERVDEERARQLSIVGITKPVMP